MLSPGVLWQAALCWAAVLSTSSAPLGHAYPPCCLPSAWSQQAQEQVGEDIPGFPPGHKGQEHPTRQRGCWEAQSRAWGPCSCPGPSQHQQDIFSTHLGETPPKMSTQS